MSRNRYATQGACIASELKRRPLTYMGMLKLGISTSPWRRVGEWLDLHPDWTLMKRDNAQGLTMWRVVKAK